jgi:hypothetical protein
MHGQPIIKMALRYCSLPCADGMVVADDVTKLSEHVKKQELPEEVKSSLFCHSLFSLYISFVLCLLALTGTALAWTEWIGFLLSLG